MNLWDQALTLQDITTDAAVLGVLLLLSTVSRRYVRLLQFYLVPNSLIAGLVGLIVGPELIGWISFDAGRMGMYVYHLLALLFIGMGLRSVETRSRGGLGFGILSLMCYLLQALVGLGVVLALVHTVRPDLVPAMGMLLPLGFGMGPGLAYSIGMSWESFGFEGAGSIGLAIAALGFFYAYLLGVWLVRRGIHSGASTLMGAREAVADHVRTGIVKSGEPECGARLTFFSGAIEPLTVHVSLIAAIYLATFVVVQSLAGGLEAVGLEQEVPLLWSFHFLVGNFLALAVRKLAERIGVAYVLDAGILNRVNGLTADLMIVTSIMAISLQIIWPFIVPILLVTLAGAAVTYFSLRFAVRHVFSDYVFERFVGIFGEMTGTLSSGLALVRVSDPEYSTPVAEDLALGSGVALVLGFPLLFIINMPFTFFNGAAFGYVVVMALCVAYLSVVYGIWRWSRRPGKSAS